MEQLSSLSFYQQVRQEYAQLFPGQRAILALVYLYERFGPVYAGEQDFTEGDVEEAVRRVAADEPITPDGNPITRVTHGHWRHLQQYLLERDRETRTYRFTAFGLALCQSLQDVFTSQVNPAQVAQIFATLRRELDATDDLLYWLQTVLPKLRGELQQQVEALAENLRIELRKLRRRTDYDDEAFDLLVKRVSEALAELAQQAADLRAAFGQADSLDAELERRWLAQVTLDVTAIEEQLRIGVGQAREFLSHIQQRLRSLERRLGLVQPRIRDLFGNLRKLQFDRNTERLLDALLHPDLLPGTWPTGLGPKSPGPSRQSIRLLSGRTERALPPQPVCARTRPPQTQAQTEFARRTQAQWDLQQRVGYWLRYLVEAIEANANEAYPFANLTRQIGQTEGPRALAVLARLVAQLRRHIAPRRSWTLEISPFEEEHIPHRDIALWKLRIRPAPKK